jgi:crotonobetainyl-CoA:carnitine CoA-transferase CaiB-like acyl-CoA transferase
MEYLLFLQIIHQNPIEKMFKNLKVIEFASVLAGPAVGMFFAELGAKVIKIENKQTNGDVTREWKLATEPQDRTYSAYYCSVNWGKEALFLDLMHNPDDTLLIYDLLKDADIVISNFKMSSAKKMGLDYDTLKALHPKLIYAHLTSFGGGDETPALDMVLQAEAGFLYMTGEPDRDPVKLPLALIDILAAHQLKEAILIALLQRYETGVGAYVTTSLLESAIASLVNQATNWLMEGNIPQRMGTMHPNIAPYGDMFKTKDGKEIILATATERQFRQFLAIVDLENILQDARFVSNQVRIQHRLALKKMLAEAILRYERDELLAILRAKSVPAGGIRTMQEVFELPTAQRMILTETMPDGIVSKRVKTVAFAIKSNHYN